MASQLRLECDSMGLSNPKLQPQPQPQPKRDCPKCGSPRVDVVGRSQSPAMLYIVCRACGYMAGVPGR